MEFAKNGYDPTLPNGSIARLYSERHNEMVIPGTALPQVEVVRQNVRIDRSYDH